MVHLGGDCGSTLVQLWCSFGSVLGPILVQLVRCMGLDDSVVIDSWFSFVWTGSVLAVGSYLVQ